MPGVVEVIYLCLYTGEADHVTKVYLKIHIAFPVIYVPVVEAWVSFPWRSLRNSEADLIVACLECIGCGLCVEAAEVA